MFKVLNKVKKSYIEIRVSVIISIVIIVIAGVMLCL